MRPSPMFGVVCVGNSNACASFITFAGFGTWATIPKCLYQMVEHSFTPNVVPGIARTEASPLLCIHVSQQQPCEGVNSRAHAKPNKKHNLSLFKSGVSTHAHTRSQTGGSCKCRWPCRGSTHAHTRSQTFRHYRSRA